ncbi:hydroxymethylpyrimidine/phosphomethylpyrimidine kinase [Candidatus Albibeggiatoa sp. nov. NOAA]|uniref:bifunctional hydroxymethylpyrimidine kinase/phosphomethylpyrimidine kinase n=1 Tax=Candidatus Albibeggiatoa sp. nov. NOAA TaxID=3162724 RepID=UPI0032FB2261|nr:hydroxymethylpyrimidine/phosphomethylpyrimidine kinase [Thiotrichaceae bacterium]
MQNSQLPIVLVFAGNDPTGGAGLCADTQALALTDCHIAPVVTCTTVQDTHNVHQILPLKKEHIFRQAEVVLNDMSIAAIKLGLLGSLDAIEAVAQILQIYPDLPVIFDPILAAGGGQNLSNQTIQDALLDLIVPRTTVITPNTQEIQKLTGLNNWQQAANNLQQKGCEWVCLTGTHDDTDQVVNRLYHQQQCVQSLHWERLPETYHGSGCTLAASVAGYIAQGKTILNAVEAAQQLTYRSLQRGYQAGQGQWLPYRIR